MVSERLTLSPPLVVAAVGTALTCTTAECFTTGTFGATIAGLRCVTGRLCLRAWCTTFLVDLWTTGGGEYVGCGAGAGAECWTGAWYTCAGFEAAGFGAGLEAGFGAGGAGSGAGVVSGGGSVSVGPALAAVWAG